MATTKALRYRKLDWHTPTFATRHRIGSKLSLLARDTGWHTLCWQQVSEVKEVLVLQNVSIREPRKWYGGAHTCFMIARKACSTKDLFVLTWAFSNAQASGFFNPSEALGTPKGSKIKLELVKLKSPERSQDGVKITARFKRIRTQKHWLLTQQAHLIRMK